MKFLSVCSGIEAASVAWHPLGWEAVAFSEIEPFPCAVLAERWPCVPNLGDMTRIEGEKYCGAVDVLIGGTPCQDFSIAGKRAGLSGERSGLALHFARLVRDIRPRWVVWENVPGAFSTGKGRDFPAFVGALAELGYGMAWRVLDSQYWGVPQRRRRIYLVGYSGDPRPAGAVLFERESLRRNTPESGKTRKDVAGTLSCRAEGRVANTLNTRSDRWDVSRDNFVTARCLSTSNQRLDFETETLVPVAIRTAQTSSNGWGINTEGVAYTMDLAAGQAVCAPVSPYGDKAGALAARHDSSPCADRGMTIVGTLNASYAGTSRPAGQGNELDFCVPTGMRVRRLTPRECERLQGFPDDYTMIEYRGKTASDGPRYKALGNSMAVPVVRWLGEQMQRADALMEEMV